MSTQAPSPPSLNDRPNHIPWPPILDAVAITLAVALERLWPLPPLAASGPVRWVGWGLFAAGAAIAVAGVAHFLTIGTPINPTARATTIARRGVYAWTRNPMYLGTLLAFAGVGIAWPSTWLLLIVPLLALGLIKLAIEPEEAFLERRFGDTYRDYKSHVRRWI